MMVKLALKRTSKNNKEKSMSRAWLLDRSILSEVYELVNETSRLIPQNIDKDEVHYPEVYRKRVKDLAGISLKLYHEYHRLSDTLKKYQICAFQAYAIGHNLDPESKEVIITNIQSLRKQIRDEISELLV